MQEWERDNELSYQVVTKCNVEMGKLNTEKQRTEQNKQGK